MRAVVSLAFEASHVLLSTAGTFYNCTITLDSTLATGTYYVAILDRATAPANGQDITSAPYVLLYLKPVVHTSGAGEDVSFGDAEEPAVGSNPGYRCTAGCVALLSSTAPTSITGSAHAWFNGGVG